jgi:hypothetical protein
MERHRKRQASSAGRIGGYTGTLVSRHGIERVVQLAHYVPPEGASGHRKRGHRTMRANVYAIVPLKSAGGLRESDAA